MTSAPTAPTAPTAAAHSVTYSDAFLDHLQARFANAADPDKELAVHGGGPRSRHRHFTDDTLPELLTFCGDFTGKRVLELGCGTGPITPVLASRAAQVVSFDVDANSVELAIERAAEHQLHNVEFVLADHYQPPSTDEEKFDLVVMHAVMEHVPLSIPGLRRSVLRSAMDALVPGGHLFIYETPNRWWPKDIHTTSLWFVPWTRPGSRRSYDRAVKAGKHRPASTDEGTVALEQRGAWGMSYREVGRYLDKGSYAVVNLDPSHARHVRHHRPLGRARSLYETAAYHLLTRPFRIPIVAVSPMLSPLVLRKIA